MPRGKRRAQKLFELEAKASGSESDGESGDADDEDNDFLDNEPVEESQPFALLFQQQQQAVNKKVTLFPPLTFLCVLTLCSTRFPASLPSVCLLFVSKLNRGCTRSDLEQQRRSRPGSAPKKQQTHRHLCTLLQVSFGEFFFVFLCITS